MKAMRKTINDATEWSVVIVEDAGLSVLKMGCGERR